MAPGSQFANVAFTFQEECERKGGVSISPAPPANTFLYRLGLEGETPPFDEIELHCGKEIGHFNYAHAACLAVWS